LLLYHNLKNQESSYEVRFCGRVQGLPSVLEGSSGGWRWTGSYKSIGQLRLDGWNAIQVTVPSDATPLYSLGVEFFSDGSNANTAYIDSVDW